VKTVTLTISDEIFRRLKSAINVKFLCTSYEGIVDQAINKLITDIEKGKEHVFLVEKNGSEETTEQEGVKK